MIFLNLAKPIAIRYGFVGIAGFLTHPVVREHQWVKLRSDTAQGEETMAVIAMWKCDRDNSMFENRKEADAHDRMLELGEQFSRLLEQVIPQVDEKAAEEFGLVLARNKELIIQACKGKPEVMSEIALKDDKVTRLAASR
ncbi:YebG family protein [Sedimenticola sp.]|uniref:YebG family protein n=2 Tax=Sedimenticola sp. TaxID=1940285 RepID=UPI003D14E802